MQLLESMMALLVVESTSLTGYLVDVLRVDDILEMYPEIQATGVQRHNGQWSKLKAFVWSMAINNSQALVHSPSDQ